MSTTPARSCYLPHLTAASFFAVSKLTVCLWWWTFCPGRIAGCLPPPLAMIYPERSQCETMLDRPRPSTARNRVSPSLPALWTSSTERSIPSFSLSPVALQFSRRLFSPFSPGVPQMPASPSECFDPRRTNRRMAACFFVRRIVHEGLLFSSHWRLAFVHQTSARFLSFFFPTRLHLTFDFSLFFVDCIGLTPPFDELRLRSLGRQDGCIFFPSTHTESAPFMIRTCVTGIVPFFRVSLVAVLHRLLSKRSVLKPVWHAFTHP